MLLLWSFIDTISLRCSIYGSLYSYGSHWACIIRGKLEQDLSSSCKSYARRLNCWLDIFQSALVHSTPLSVEMRNPQHVVSGQSAFSLRLYLPISPCTCTHVQLSARAASRNQENDIIDL